jgi:phage replication O-like protein O
MPASRVTNTTPFPNLLLDRVMPFLGDTEWRMLCVIVRQTFGWRKSEDWLSHSQLKSRTGRESAAVSRAVDTLVKRGLIVIRDRNDRRLHSTAERRRSRSRLVFAVHPLLLDSPLYRQRIGFGYLGFRSSKGENNKSKSDSKKETSGATG